MPSPVVIELDPAERDTLLGWVSRPTAQNRQRLRAQIVLLAADDWSNQQIARHLGRCEDTVRKWRGRFALQRVKGLADKPRSGRPRKYTALQTAQVKAIACSPPADRDLPLARWSVSEITRQAVAEGVVTAISRATVARYLTADAIKPWQYRYWISPTDPEFAIKAGRVLDLYARTWQGHRLHDDEYVISADEKPGIQALRRRGAGPTRPGHPRHVEFDYRRGGTLAYLAALDVHNARVIGHIDQTTGISPFTALVDKVMTVEPYASAKRVYWLVDNGSSHRGWTAAERLNQAYPNATMIHLPVHASWLNQIEIYFSILSRKALTGESFDNLEALTERILAFEHRYNQTAQPFNWRYTRADLNAYLTRLGPAA
jgi:transposase